MSRQYRPNHRVNCDLQSGIRAYLSPFHTSLEYLHRVVSAGPHDPFTK